MLVKSGLFIQCRPGFPTPARMPSGINFTAEGNLPHFPLNRFLLRFVQCDQPVQPPARLNIIQGKSIPRAEMQVTSQTDRYQPPSGSFPPGKKPLTTFVSWK